MPPDHPSPSAPPPPPPPPPPISLALANFASSNSCQPLDCPLIRKVHLRLYHLLGELDIPAEELTYKAKGVTILHSVDVVRLLIFSYMKYKSHLALFFKLKKVSTIGFEPGPSDCRAGTLSTRLLTTSC